MLKIILKKYKARAKEQSSLARKLLSEEKEDFPHFSVSHKHYDGYAHILLALSFDAVGTDLEILTEKDKALLDFFKNDEYEMLGNKNWENFYTLWTAKEAVIKLFQAKTDLRQHIKLQKSNTPDSTRFNLVESGALWNKNKIYDLKTNFNEKEIFISIFKKSKYIIAIAQKGN